MNPEYPFKDAQTNMKVKMQLSNRLELHIHVPLQFDIGERANATGANETVLDFKCICKSNFCILPSAVFLQVQKLAMFSEPFRAWNT